MIEVTPPAKVELVNLAQGAKWVRVQKGYLYRSFDQKLHHPRAMNAILAVKLRGTLKVSRNPKARPIYGGVLPTNFDYSDYEAADTFHHLYSCGPGYTDRLSCGTQNGTQRSIVQAEQEVKQTCRPSFARCYRYRNTRREATKHKISRSSKQTIVFFKILLQVGIRTTAAAESPLVQIRVGLGNITQRLTANK